jgi:S-DNA-T family DNA segregation ATPase FtsK/SpoIIIE
VQRSEPQKPPVSSPARFPWVPALTPVILSVMMALIFQSSLALMMGVLGPAMVAGSWWETRRAQRKRARQALAEYAQASLDYRHNQELDRRAEKDRALRAQPGILAQASNPFWRKASVFDGFYRVGTGRWEPPTGHALEGQGPLSGMPGVIDTAQGVALVGPQECHGIWRMLVTGWIAHTPREHRDSLSRSYSWATGDAPRDIRGPSRAVWVDTLEEVPDECHILITPLGEHLVTIHDSDGSTRALKPDLLTSAQFAWVCDRLGFLEESRDKTVVPDYARRDQLFVDVGAFAPWDLVQEGPHVVVWGSTGSGKSVSVCSMVASVAQHYSPRDVVCVIVDFKGGAGLAPLIPLPHTVGSVTDLDGNTAQRARHGIGREMVAREKLLLHHQVSDCGKLPAEVECPRLLIIIDEAAWLLGSFPIWAELLADVLARGRSLGIHVIIATQRVQGVLTPAMMANISLRLCGRISDDAELTSWMPGIAPSRVHRLRHGSPGVALVAGAHTSSTEVTVIAHGHLGRALSHTPSRWAVWSPELPDRVSLEPGHWAVADNTQTRNLTPVTYDPGQEGSVLVVGDSRSGRTTALAALASQCDAVSVAPDDPYELWLLLRRQTQGGPVLVIDNVDDQLRRAGHDGGALIIDALEGHTGIVLMSINGSFPLARSLARVVKKKLVLSLAQEDSALVWGGPGEVSPGRAQWSHTLLQVATGATLPEPHKRSDELHTRSPPLVVTYHPSRWAGTETAFLGSPDAAMLQWPSLNLRLETHSVVIDGPGPMEMRHVSAGRIILPALPVPEGVVQVWEGGKILLVSPTHWRH